MKEKIEISKEELKRIYEWLRTAKINTEHLFQRLNQKWPEYMSRDIDDILNKVYVMLDGKGTPCVYQIQYFAYEEEYAQEPTQMNGGLFSSIINARADLVQLEKELGKQGNAGPVQRTVDALIIGVCHRAVVFA